jgi:ATP-binding protein involved in chromosome partitioning
MAGQHDRLSEAQVYEALKTVKYPGYSRDIVSFGMVQGVQIRGHDIGVTIQITTNQQHIAVQLRQATEEALRTLPGGV